MPELQPTYISIDPVTGEATGLFPGGVQILAGTNQTPPNDRRIRWVAEDDGALVADIFGFRQGADSGLILSSHDEVGSGNTFTELQAVDDTDGSYAQLAVELIDTVPRSAVVQAFTNTPTFGPNFLTILGTDGGSDFVQVGSGGSKCILAPLAWAVPGLAAAGGFIGAALDTGLPFAGAAVRIGFGALGVAQWGQPSYALSNIAGNLGIAAAVNNVSGAASGAATLTALAFLFY